MLVLMCYVGGCRYAIDSQDVVEVVSYVRLQPIHQAPAWLAGIFAYRGTPTPVVDLSHFVLGGRCPVRWSTRIVVAKLEVGGVERSAGLLVERATTVELEQMVEQDDARDLSDSLTFGPLLLDNEGMFQLVELPRLLPIDRQQALFPTAPGND